jgi:hypothetical protein
MRKSLQQVLSDSPPPFTPFEWQKADIAGGLLHDRYALFIPVGGGKTFCGTAIALGWGDPTVLVLVPPILIRQWVKYLNELPNSGGAIAFEGSPKKRHSLPIENYRWIVMSLQVFKNDHRLLTQNYLHAEVTTLVDEAQHLKNPASGNYKLVRDFSECRKLLLMTGTPLNKPLDAFSYIKLKTPAVYRNFAHFQNMHVADYDIFNNPTGYVDLPTVTEHLYKQSAHRTAEEIHALNPRCNYKPIEYALDSKHLKLYKQIAEEMLLDLPNGERIDMTTASALYHGLQQTIVSWSHFAGEEGLRPSIFDVVDQTLDETAWDQGGSSKLVIWSYYKRTTEALLAYMNNKRAGSTVAAYSGSNSAKAAEAFENNSKVTCIIAQPGSAGSGVNFQYVSWESLFVELPPPGSVGPFRQALGRIDRTGQTRNPTQRFAIAQKTLQVQRIRDLMENDDVVSKVVNEKALRLAIFGG